MSKVKMVRSTADNIFLICVFVTLKRIWPFWFQNRPLLSSLGPWENGFWQQLGSHGSPVQVAEEYCGGRWLDKGAERRPSHTKLARTRKK